MKSILKHFTLFLLLLSLSITQISVVNATGLCSQTASTPKEGTDDPLAITAKAAVLIENNSGRILYQKNKDKELIPASITKIMTLLLIFDAIDQKKLSLNDSVSVSEYAAKMGGSQVFLESGETQTVQTMIKCISIASANDAAVAMADVWLSPCYGKMMNTKAKQLGMKHTHFKNCNGLDDTIESGHYSSAYDVALMSRELVTKHPEISNYSTTWMDEITHKTRLGETKFGLTNTNKLIRTYQGITGLKTGSTSKAKYCLSATANRNGISLTAVVMAAPDHKIRFAQAANLLDYGFANCKAYHEKQDAIPLKKQKAAHSIAGEVLPRIEKNFTYTITQNENPKDIKRSIQYKKNLQAPIKEGDVIGKITYTLNEETIGTLPIVSAQTIKKASYMDYIRHVFGKFLFQA